MKKITLLIAAFIMSIGLYAQEVIVDQGPAGKGIAAGMYEEGGAQVLAEDINLDSDMRILDATFYGFSVLPNTLSDGLETDGVLTHFNLFIVPADASGLPVDLLDESVIELEIPLDHEALDVLTDMEPRQDDPNMNEWLYVFTVDVAEFLGEDDAVLAEGDYWLAPVPYFEDDFEDTDYMWYWMNSQTFGNGEQPTYYTGSDGWVNLNEAAGSFDYMAMAMTVTGEEATMSVDDHNFDSFTHYINNNELVLDAVSNQIDGVAIYNLLGQEVVNENINATSGSIDLNALSAGVYVTKVTIDGQTKTFKFSKN